jgi:hypothetical protein
LEKQQVSRKCGTWPVIAVGGWLIPQIIYERWIMFGYEDRRTKEERNRDLELADKRNAEGLLSIGFLKTNIRQLLKDSGANVGIVGNGLFGSAELLAEVDGVTYKITVRVDHDG